MKKRHRYLLWGGIAAEFLVFAASVFVIFPYDSGGFVRWMDSLGIGGIWQQIVLVMIPLLLFVCFGIALACSGRILSGSGLSSVFWGWLLLLFGDEKRWPLSYEILHGLNSFFGIVMVLLAMPVMILLAIVVKKLWGRKAAALSGLLLAGAILLCRYVGFNSLFAKGVYILSYIILTLSIPYAAELLEKKQRMTFCIGVFVVIWFCGQFVFSPGRHVYTMNMLSKIEQLSEMFDVIRENTGDQDIMIAGNNAGLKLLMVYDRGISIPYDPNEIAGGKWSRYQYDLAEIRAYEAAEAGEYGLSALVAYAEQKGCRYILLADVEHWLADNMAAGGYNLLYETEDMMLFYK